MEEEECHGKCQEKVDVMVQGWPLPEALDKGYGTRGKTMMFNDRICGSVLDAQMQKEELNKDHQDGLIEQSIIKMTTKPVPGNKGSGRERIISHEGIHA